MNDNISVLMRSIMSSNRNTDLGSEAYPLSYFYQSTNCRGCDLMPLATLAHANSTLCTCAYFHPIERKGRPSFD